MITVTKILPAYCPRCGFDITQCACGPLPPATGYPDGRDGPEMAASEIVMRLVGYPSLSAHEWVTGVIRRHLKERGARPDNELNAATAGDGTKEHG